MNVAMNEREIFLNAVEKPDETARTAYLDEVCAGDQELRSKVEELLAANKKTDNFLEQPLAGLALTIHSDNPETWDDSLRSLSLDFLAPSEKAGCLGTLNQYEVIGAIGRGAFGIVLRAYDTKLNRIVAIKVMAPELASNPMAVKRFLREAQAAAAVRHDHVVTIHAIEETSDPPFIVMEFVEGQSLKEKVERDGALELTEILRIGKQMASGLVAAHEQGLVHRDIKPANILLENTIKRVKITDFGLARAVDDVGMTQTGIIAGTPQYMSPEQGLGQPFDARSDLFSLGSVLYTLCTGRPAFRADSAVATLRRVCDDEPRSIRAVNPQIPEWLENIIMRLLEKDANVRIQTAEEVEDVLGTCLAHVQSSGSTSPLPRPLLAAAEQKHSSRKRIAGERAMLFITLVKMQLVAIVITCVVAFVELSSIVITAPLFGIGLGAAITAAAGRARLGWVNVGFGLFWVVSVLLVYIGAIIAQDIDEEHVMVALVICVLVGFPWGIHVLRQVRTGQITGLRSFFAPTDGKYIGLLVLQLVIIAASGANAMIESESILVTGTVIFMLGCVLSVYSYVTNRSKLSLLFAVSGPSFSVLLLMLLLRQGGIPGPTGIASFAWVFFLYVIAIVPLGLFTLAKELRLISKFVQLRLQFNLKVVLAGMALFAVIFAFARPFYAFSVGAFLAGSLFVATAGCVAGMLAVNAYVRAAKPPRKQLISIAVVTLVSLGSVTGLAGWYETVTDHGFILIRTAEPVQLEVHHVDSNRTYTNERAGNGSVWGDWPSGEIQVKVKDRDDLKAIPARLTLRRSVPARVQIVPVDSQPGND